MVVVVLPLLSPSFHVQTWRPGYQYTVNTELVHAPLLGSASANVPPTVKLMFETSPLVATVELRSKAFYKFITSTAAVVGGVFTVLKLLADAALGRNCDRRAASSS
jgi:hypothetical protein